VVRFSIRVSLSKLLLKAASRRRFSALAEAALRWLLSERFPLAPGLCANLGLLARNKYGTYCIPPGTLHRPCAATILKGGVWESSTIDLVCRNVGDGDLVTAGTFFGDFLPPYSRSTNGLIWAFEPVPENYSCALWTQHLSGLSNVILQNVALSDKFQQLEMGIATLDGIKYGGGSYVHHGIAKINQGRNGLASSEFRLSVPAFPLDLLIPLDRDVRVLQLDVEGHERAVLDGARNLITRCRPLLVLETLPENWLAEHGKELGYELVGRVDENWVLKSEAHRRHHHPAVQSRLVNVACARVNAVRMRSLR
jgi:FkbM family methyltransferase